MKLFQVRASFNWGIFDYTVWAKDSKEAALFVKTSVKKEFAEYVVGKELTRLVNNLSVTELPLTPGVLFCNAGYIKE